jgi:hypothetical protein
MTDLTELALTALSQSYQWLDTNNFPTEIIAHTDEWVLLKRHDGEEEAWPLEKGAKDHFLLNFHLPVN